MLTRNSGYGTVYAVQNFKADVMLKTIFSVKQCGKMLKTAIYLRSSKSTMFGHVKQRCTACTSYLKFNEIETKSIYTA